MLKGKTAVITGANGGIGRALLDRFAFFGADIWACARSETSDFALYCREIAEKYQRRVTPLFFDVTNESEMKEAVKAIKGEKRSIDILINNAGAVPENKLFQMASVEECRRIFEVNFFSVVKLTQMISKSMIRQKQGSIVNISSVSALDGEPGQYEYISGKAALIGLTRKLAREMGIFNIRINSLAPGIVDTGVSRFMEENLKNRIVESAALKRLAKPEEIADVAAFLASDLSSYITGQVIRVDGGL
ncbi:MAG: SDR family oxidoreductase [Selenomonadaceae bacterium]|nr:SDR family oxidoreductase [Selenomonadaceae bacterium]